MPGTELPVLHHGFRSETCSVVANAIRICRSHHDDPAYPGLAHGRDDVTQNGTARDGVHDLWEGGFHTPPFTGRQNDARTLLQSSLAFPVQPRDNVHLPCGKMTIYNRILPRCASCTV